MPDITIQRLRISTYIRVHLYIIYIHIYICAGGRHMQSNIKDVYTVSNIKTYIEYLNECKSAKAFSCRAHSESGHPIAYTFCLRGTYALGFKVSIAKDKRSYLYSTHKPSEIVPDGRRVRGACPRRSHFFSRPWRTRTGLFHFIGGRGACP